MSCRRCWHRVFLTACGRCRSSANLARFVSEWDRIAARVRTLRDEEGEATPPRDVA